MVSVILLAVEQPLLLPLRQVAPTEHGLACDRFSFDLQPSPALNITHPAINSVSVHVKVFLRFSRFLLEYSHKVPRQGEAHKVAVDCFYFDGVAVNEVFRCPVNCTETPGSHHVVVCRSFIGRPRRFQHQLLLVLAPVAATVSIKHGKEMLGKT